VLILTIKNCL